MFLCRPDVVISKLCHYSFFLYKFLKLMFDVYQDAMLKKLLTNKVLSDEERSV